VHKPGFYDPDINPTYQEMASHYSVAVIPARSKKPRDKPKAELSVLLVQRWVLARLRNQRFFNLDEANRAIAALLTDLNNRPFKKLPGCRRSVFDEIDRPALRPLPERPYQYAEWKVARVGPDYHVELDQHYYSVPYRYAREQVDIAASALPHTAKALAVGITPRSTRTCRRSIWLSPKAGIRSGCVTGLPTSVRTRRPSSSTCWAPASTRSNPIEPAWACCAWARTTGATGSKPPAAAPSI
jgi:transposase